MKRDTLTLASLLLIGSGALAQDDVAGKLRNVPGMTNVQPLSNMDGQTVGGLFSGTSFTLHLPHNWNHSALLYAPDPLATDPDDGTVAALQATSSADGTAFGTLSGLSGFAVAESRAGLDGLAQAVRALGGTSIYLAGRGLGGLGAVMNVEASADYAGGLALCAPLAGGPALVAYLTDFRVVYDDFTRNLAGTRLSGLQDPTDPATLPATDQVHASVSALFEGAATIDRFKANLGQIGDVSGARATPESFEAALNAYSSLVPDLRRRYGGFPYDNTATTYQGSMDDSPMNAAVFRTPGQAQAVAALTAETTPSGRLQAPLLAVADLSDPVYAQTALDRYRTRVAGAGQMARFVGWSLPGAAHPCDLDAQTVTRAWITLHTWSQGGPAPTADNP